jgi:hypothetical protein
MISYNPCKFESLSLKERALVDVPALLEEQQSFA